MIDMSKPLQDYAARDSGFVQFCERYKIVASDPTAHRQYISWVKDIMREQGMKEAAWLEGLEEGKTIGNFEGKTMGFSAGRKAGWEKGVREGRIEGKEEGRIEATKTVALNMLRKNLPVEQVAELTSLPIEEVKALRVSPVQ